MTTMRSINPATGEMLAEYPTLAPAELEHRLALAADAAIRSDDSSMTALRRNSSARMSR
jgi:acyl-CoA reductase-like NAD-dependent aldehyde dehydrogenase